MLEERRIISGEIIMRKYEQFYCERCGRLIGYWTNNHDQEEAFCLDCSIILNLNSNSDLEAIGVSLDDDNYPHEDKGKKEE